MKRTKGKRDLKQGLELFHRLYPSPGPPSPVPVSPALQKGPENDYSLRTEPPFLPLPRMVSEPTVSLRRQLSDTEKELDALAPQPRPYLSSRILKPRVQPSISTQPSLFSVSPAPPAFPSPHHNKAISALITPKIPPHRSPPVYINLPQLPFGAHQSYNDIHSLRSMILSPDKSPISETYSDTEDQTDGNTYKIEGLNRVKSEEICRKPGKRELRTVTKFPYVGSDTRRAYLVESGAVLTRRKFRRTKRLPQRYFKHIYEQV